MLIDIILFLFGRGIKSAYRLDSFAREHFEELPDNHKVKLKGFNNSCLVFWKDNGKIYTRLGKSAISTDTEIEISFKTKKAASMVLTGRRSIADGYARHDIFIDGDIFLTLPVMRVFEIVVCYLLPKFMTKKMFYELPKRSRSKFRFYLKVLFNI